MIIELEGPDGSGKGTAARSFSEAYGVMSDGQEALILKAGQPDPPDRDPFEEYETGLADKLPVLTDSLVVLDRWALGEMIYGPLLRGHSRLTPGGMLHVSMFMKALGARRYVLLPPEDTLMQRFTDRGDDLIDKDDLMHIWHEYDRLGHQFGYEIIRSDIPPAALLFGNLLELSKIARRAEELAAFAPGYIGTLTPRVVLAGDVRAGDHLAAFTPASRQGCAYFFTEHLANYADIVLTKVGILNTGEPGMNLREADRFLGTPRWIALGRAAEERLNRAGLITRYVPHPQAARRFASKGDYGMAVMRAAHLI